VPTATVMALVSVAVLVAVPFTSKVSGLVMPLY
jgi:hypothetical protein